MKEPMDQKKFFHATPHGRAFIQVFQMLQQDFQYRAEPNRAWLATLALFGQCKNDLVRPLGSDMNSLTRPADYWRKMTSELGLEEEFFMAPLRAAIHEEALATITDLISTWGTADWDFFDSPMYLAGKGAYEFPFGVSPEVADLVAQTFGDVKGKYAWCLFDGSCQIAYRLAKSGANVVLSGGNPAMDVVLRLMNRLHDVEVRSWNPLASKPSENTCLYDIGVAFPPIGMRQLPHAFAHSSFDDDDAWPGQQNRPEIFALRAMWEKIGGKSVIFAPPSLLFSTGLERQAREHLVFDLNAVDAVIQLPARQLASSGVNSALLILSHQRRADEPIRLIDASNSTEKEGRTGIKMQAVSMISALVRKETTDQSLARDIPIQNFLTLDVSLHPARYFGLTSLAGEVVTLGDVIEEAVLRPPAKPAGRDEEKAEEINISDLGEWGYVGQKTKTKTIAVRQTKLQASRLRNDDIVFSIKGSLGKVGIFYNENTDLSKTYVVSQSCIALRLSAEGKRRVRPITLFMYLRSATGRAAIDGLNVGSTIPHIQPGALIEHLKIPVLPLAEQETLEQTFYAMMALQDEIRDKQDQLDTLSKSFWPAQDADVNGRPT